MSEKNENVWKSKKIKQIGFKQRRSKIPNPNFRPNSKKLEYIRTIKKPIEIIWNTCPDCQP